MESILLVLLVLAIIVVAVAGLYYLYRSGCFHVVQVSTGRPDFYEMNIAYKVYKGDYKASGKPFGAITELCPGFPCVSVYYDDPDKIPAEQCRYICGVILAEGPDDKPDADALRKLRENDFRFETFPRVEFVVKATFPYFTFMSFMIGAMKTYPKLTDYIKKKKLHAYPYIEVYKDNLVHFMVPLSKHDEFLVEEVKKR